MTGIAVVTTDRLGVGLVAGAGSVETVGRRSQKYKLIRTAAKHIKTSKAPVDMVLPESCVRAEVV
jgi:hypothetical protein